MSRVKTQTIGICCICGKDGILSKEHVPPQKAFNDMNLIAYEWENRLTNRKVKGKTVQGGYYAYTLCELCNNNTGSWYGREYVKWAKNCQQLLVTLKQHKVYNANFTLVDVYPLRFLKQVVTCFFSEIGYGFNNIYPDLSGFILDKNAIELPDGLRFFMNLYPFASTTTAIHHNRFSGRIRMSKDLTVGDAISFFEIAHPPFQLIMTLDNENITEASEITDFSKYRYEDCVALPLHMKVVRDTSSPLPIFS